MNPECDEWEQADRDYANEVRRESNAAWERERQVNGT